MHQPKPPLHHLITTSDGSHTIYVPDLNEHYHSVHGAVQESNFIFINTGFERCNADPVRILEVGFGTGLNALLTALKSITGKKEVYYTSIEKYPLDETILSSLNHHLYAGNSGKELSHLIHLAEWNKWVKICKNFTLRKIERDIADASFDGKYDLIYFDAFGPDKQPEMWTTKLIASVAAVTEKDGALVTYSAKGEVKRNLIACGFEVTLLPGPPGKRQIIRAVKI